MDDESAGGHHWVLMISTECGCRPAVARPATIRFLNITAAVAVSELPTGRMQSWGQLQEEADYLDMQSHNNEVARAIALAEQQQAAGQTKQKVAEPLRADLYQCYTLKWCGRHALEPFARTTHIKHFCSLWLTRRWGCLLRLRLRLRRWRLT